MTRRSLVVAGVAALLVLLGLRTPVVGNATVDSQTNAYRVSQGLDPLATWAALQPVADLRLAQTIALGSLQHPSSYQFMFDMLPGCTEAIGENLAYYSSGYEPAGWPVSAWIVSDSHRANLLRDWDWQASAVGQSGGRTYAVQVFAKGCAGGIGQPIVDTLTDTAAPTPDQARANRIFFLVGGMLALTGLLALFPPERRCEFCVHCQNKARRKT